MHEQTAIYIELQVDPADIGLIYIHSKDVPGLHLHGTHLRDMKPQVESVIRRLLKVNEGIEVGEIIWLRSKAQPQTDTDALQRLALFQEAA